MKPENEPRAFLTRARARAYARDHGGRVVRGGVYGIGSFGLRPQDRVRSDGTIIRSDDQIMMVWFVE